MAKHTPLDPSSNQGPIDLPFNEQETQETNTSTSQETNTPTSFENFLKDFNPEESHIVIPRGSQLTKESGTEVIQNFADKSDISYNQALIVMAILFQTGGTNRSCDGNLQTEISGKTIKLATLRSSLRECKQKGGERKLARLFATEIFQVAQKLKIPGNLYKRSTRLNPGKNIGEIESFWLSDFQIDNVDCPVGTMTLIQQVFDDRKNIKLIKPPKKK